MPAEFNPRVGISAAGRLILACGGRSHLHLRHGDHFDFFPAFAAYPHHCAVCRQIGLATDHLHGGHTALIVSFTALCRLTGLFGFRRTLRPDAPAPIFRDIRQVVQDVCGFRSAG